MTSNSSDVDVEKYVLADVDVVFSEEISITENEKYDVSQFEVAQVDAPTGVFPEGALSITSNGDYDVTTIGSSALEGRTELTTAVLGNSTEYIHDRVFYNCRNITKVLKIVHLSLAQV